MAKPAKKVVTKYRTWKCKCGVRYSIHDRDTDAVLIPDRFKCWSKSVDGKECRYYFTRNDKLSNAFNIVRGFELFQIINNMGSDKERKCSPEEVRKLLGKKLVGMSLAAAPDFNRALINSFTLEGGITVHLAPSTKGVTVYRVVRE